MISVALHNGQMVKLGRIRPKVRPQVLAFASYYDPERDAVPPPLRVDWYSAAMASVKRVYLNDQYGDCVIAGKYHLVGSWTGNESGNIALGNDSEVLQSYHRICGPGDNGCVITDVLDWFQQRGLPLGGVLHKIDGYLAIDWTNKLLVQVALELFGGLTLGINLPSDWTCTNCTWDVTRSGIVGGHDVCALGYDEHGVQIATWGGLVTITWAAFTSHQWIEECYCHLSPDWYSKGNLAPNGVKVDDLRADLEKLKSGEIPPLPDPNPPPVPVPPGPPPSGATITLSAGLAAGTYAVQARGEPEWEV